MKEHPNHKEYIIHKNGEIIGKSGLKLKSHTCNKGYCKVKVDKVSRLVHRLVAETYLDNPNNLPQVNHIDGNKHNNNVENLEWCDATYNKQHFLYKQGITYQIYKDGKLFEETNNLNLFSKQHNVPKTSLYRYVDKNKSYKGFEIKLVLKAYLSSYNSKSPTNST